MSRKKTRLHSPVQIDVAYFLTMQRNPQPSGGYCVPVSQPQDSNKARLRFASPWGQGQALDASALCVDTEGVNLQPRGQNGKYSPACPDIPSPTWDSPHQAQNFPGLTSASFSALPSMSQEGGADPQDEIY
jgi:hypothetical protein